MGVLKIKALTKEVTDKAKKILKPIIVKHTDSGCRTCGGRR